MVLNFKKIILFLKKLQDRTTLSNWFICPCLFWPCCWKTVQVAVFPGVSLASVSGAEGKFLETLSHCHNPKALTRASGKRHCFQEKKTSEVNALYLVRDWLQPSSVEPRFGNTQCHVTSTWPVPERRRSACAFCSSGKWLTWRVGPSSDPDSPLQGKTANEEGNRLTLSCLHTDVQQVHVYMW